MITQTAIFVSKQLATAQAIAPVAKSLEGQGVKSIIFSYPPSQHYFKKVNINFISIDSFEDSVAHFPPRSQIAFIFTGTSLDVEDDQKFWNFSRSLNVKCFAYVDQWVNLKERFSLNGRLVKPPDEILLVDQTAENLIKNMGINSSLKIVGSPQWDILSQIDRHPSYYGKGKWLAAFATEPISPQIGERKFKKAYGFTDLDSLNFAINLLSKHIDYYKSSWSMLIKLHPTDTRERLENFLNKLKLKNDKLSIKLTSLSREEIFSKANCILGMTSMFLVESARIGIPTISLQPNRITTSSALAKRDSLYILSHINKYKIKQFDQWIRLERTRSKAIGTSAKDICSILEKSCLSPK